jgi:hypothetical protein
MYVYISRRHRVQPTTQHPVRKILVVLRQQPVTLVEDLEEGQALLKRVDHHFDLEVFLPLSRPKNH